MKTDFLKWTRLKGKTICTALGDDDYFRFRWQIKYQNQSFSYPTKQDELIAFFQKENISKYVKT